MYIYIYIDNRVAIITRRPPPFPAILKTVPAIRQAVRQQVELKVILYGAAISACFFVQNEKISEKKWLGLVSLVAKSFLNVAFIVLFLNI